MDRCGEGEKLVKQPKQVIKINPYFLLHYRLKKKKLSRNVVKATLNLSIALFLLFQGAPQRPRWNCSAIATNETVGCMVPKYVNSTTCMYLGCCWNDTQADATDKCYTKR